MQREISLIFSNIKIILNILFIIIFFELISRIIFLFKYKKKAILKIHYQKLNSMALLCKAKNIIN